ncbi:MAG: ABC transporter substrate-binding protein [Calditrichaeota bacterium]|nr:ABC transporter substrate-binding protein [Calditrichota bacterium]
MKRFLIAIFLISVILSGCSKTQSNQPRILVSPKGLSHSFWVTVKKGAEAAGKDFHAEIIWKGPAVETDIAGQIAILEDYINKKVDAIVLAACDTKALIPVVEKAHQKGIKIITIDSGLDSDIPLSLIATDNIAAAKKAAHVLAGLIHQKGKVACIPFVPGAATSIMREEGFKQGLKEFPGIKLVAVQYSQSDVATAMNVMENILTAHPDLDGVFTANEAGTIGAVQALISRNKTGQVKVVGFDAAPNEIEALKAGHLQALIVQNPYKMGYKGVEMAVLALQGKTIPKRIDTGVYVVTKDNLDSPEIKNLLPKL